MDIATANAGCTFVDQIHAADEIVRVVKDFDEMAETFGGIGGQVKHVVELLFGEQALDQCGPIPTTLEKDLCGICSRNAL